MDPQDEVVHEIRKKMRTLWNSIIFFGLIAILGIFLKKIIITFLGLLLVVPCIWALSKFKKTLQNEMADYQPGKGFGFFRKTGEQKIKYITYAQLGIAGLVVLCLFLNIATLQAIVTGIIGILVFQYMIKKRITLHTKIDDASLFELEELGFISSKDIVKALYKDFESWSNVKPGNKIFLVKQDALVCVIIQDKQEAIRVECRLRDIKKLGLLGSGKEGEGLLLLIGTAQNEVVRLKMEGSSFQDSPEQFMTHFLQALDEALLSKAVTMERDSRHSRHIDQMGPAATRMLEMPQQITIRELDFERIHEGENRHQVQSNKYNGRHIDL
ncbi:hypothetical protein ACFLFF_00790 [Brevibacillus reuszeri]|uniref:hypothetical protein n=1 Tax=Brevibacillus reuszeri TaxID=54915 RepID=UPI003670FD84